MGHEQLGQATAAALDAQRGHLRRQVGRLLHGAQPLQGTDHAATSGQLRTTGVGAELALAAEPHHDHGSQEAQGDFRHDAGHPIGHTRALVFLVVVAVQGTVDRIAGDLGNHDHKGVHHALDQGQGHHVAVGHVADFVGQHRFYFITAHMLKQTGAHRHQRVVAAGAGGEGIGLGRLEDRHLGHGNARPLGLGAHGLHQPGFNLVAGLFNHIGAGGLFRHPLRDRQGDERAAHPEDGGKHEQGPHIEPLLGKEAIHAQHTHGDAQHHHDGQVGHQKQKYTFHINLFGVTQNADVSAWAPEQWCLDLL